MLENNFKIRLEMLSDWQVGTGAGIPGSVDELISKDSKGFPQVPAKTIVGIWRDALERLCFGLDNGDKNGNWQKWVEIIFGSQPNVEKNPNKIPIPATLSLQPARISEILRAKIANDERLRQALFFVKVGVKIDELSGTSSTEMLRFEEMGRIGTVLQADCELRINDKTAKALLVLSAELVERIGGKRRRGAGRCKFSIENLMSKDDAITHLKTFQNGEKSPIPQIEEKADEIEFENSVETNEWQTCEYTLTLETPVSIVKAVLGNVSEALDFVPGTYLISHFIKHCGQDVFKAIQNNNFQISPATISIDGKRGFPVPKVFAQEKQKKEIIYNRLLENLDGKDQTKPIREGYVSDLFSDTVSHAFTPQTLLMHNAVDDSFQRPTTDVVGIYSREAIKAGIVLEGEIRFRNIQIEGSSIKGKVRIGTSKKDDYGLARLELKTAKPFKPKSVANSRKLVVYLASDVMLRNNKLRQTNLVEDLAKALGLEDEKVIYQQIAVRRMESWQVGWGFPRPTLTLMQAGSVVVFGIRNFDTFTEEQKSEFYSKLLEIEKNGIGERRGEGYGQIIFNPAILTKKINTWKHIKKPEFSGNEINLPINSNEKLSEEESEFARLIEENAWREELKISVSKIAANEDLRKEIFGFEIESKDNSKKSIPPMAQISGLRSVISRLQSNTDEEKQRTTKIVSDWLEHLEKTPNRFDKWKEERIIKIRKLIENKGRVWSVLSEAEIERVNVWKSPKCLVQAMEVLQKKLWAEAVKSLFYACQHAHKRDTEKGGQD